MNEFFNMFCDKFEGLIMGTPQENLLKDIFGGRICNQLIGQQNCTHISERDEPSFFISLEVKNMKTLENSLEEYVRGESLGEDSYKCEKCDKKVDTIKRQVIRKLPPILIFHLKRFEFDFETMQKVKVNERLEFPQKINMRPYTREGMSERDRAEGKIVVDAIDGKDAQDIETSEEYYDYELTGILVHMGTSDSGHYYSFIREREEEGLWYEFNDSFVDSFDPKVNRGGRGNFLYIQMFIVKTLSPFCLFLSFFVFFLSFFLSSLNKIEHS